MIHRVRGRNIPPCLANHHAELDCTPARPVSLPHLPHLSLLSPSWCTSTPLGISTGPFLVTYEVVGLRKKKGSLGAVLLSSLMWAA